jgi:hypothetical protein
MKILRIFLDVNLERNEIVVDIRRKTCVFVRLFLEPRTRSSTRSRGKIDEHRPLLFTGEGDRLVSIGQPIYKHFFYPKNILFQAASTNSIDAYFARKTKEKARNAVLVRVLACALRGQKPAF